MRRAMKRSIFLMLWALLIVVTLSIYWFYLADDLEATLEQFQQLAEQHYLWLVTVYLLFIAVRGLTLMPSTPLLFVGILLFPDWFAYLLNMLGILVSSWLVILAVKYTGYGKRLERLHNPQVQRLQRNMQAHGAPIIVTWSFFPLVPTDLIVYIATLLRFRQSVILGSVLVGEAVLNAIYVFGGAAILRSAF